MEAQQAPEEQQAVLLAPIGRDIVRHKTRTMLRSHSLNLQGLAVSDLGLVEQAARASGKAAAIEPELAMKLPTQFVELVEPGQKPAAGRASYWRHAVIRVSARGQAS